MQPLNLPYLCRFELPYNLLRKGLRRSRLGNAFPPTADTDEVIA
jgi:hypothetical protein